MNTIEGLVPVQLAAMWRNSCMRGNVDTRARVADWELKKSLAVVQILFVRSNLIGDTFRSKTDTNTNMTPDKLLLHIHNPFTNERASV